VAEPRRRQILDLLAGGERPVNDLVALLDRLDAVLAELRETEQGDGGSDE
jgi:hypothetical protein